MEGYHHSSEPHTPQTLVRTQYLHSLHRLLSRPSRPVLAATETVRTTLPNRNDGLGSGSRP